MNDYIMKPHTTMIKKNFQRPELTNDSRDAQKQYSPKWDYTVFYFLADFIAIAIFPFAFLSFYSVSFSVGFTFIIASR